MAHHASTPQSVLNAPSVKPEQIIAHEGATRLERRHGVASASKPDDLVLYLRTPNVPFVRTTPRRGRRVRRGGLA